MWDLSLFKSSKQNFLFPVCIFKFSSDRMLTNYIGWEYWMLFNNWTIGKFLLINWYLEYGMYVVVVWISNVATVVVVAYFGVDLKLKVKNNVSMVNKNFKLM